MIKFNMSEKFAIRHCTNVIFSPSVNKRTIASLEAKGFAKNGRPVLSEIKKVRPRIEAEARVEHAKVMLEKAQAEMNEALAELAKVK